MRAIRPTLADRRARKLQGQMPMFYIWADAAFTTFLTVPEPLK